MTKARTLCVALLGLHLIAYWVGDEGEIKKAVAIMGVNIYFAALAIMNNKD